MQHSEALPQARNTLRQQVPLELEQLLPSQQSVWLRHATPGPPQQLGKQVGAEHTPLQQSAGPEHDWPAARHGVAQATVPSTWRGPAEALPNGPTPQAFCAATRYQKKRPAGGFSGKAPGAGGPATRRQDESGLALATQYRLTSSPRCTR